MLALKKTMTVAVSVLLWGIILLAALYAFTTLALGDDMQVSSVAGFTPLAVESDSMVPVFKSGDLIFIKKCDPSTLEEGDIITFHTIINNKYALNTHRIEDITTENGVRGYVTKGDNNVIADTHVISDGDIVGRYVGKIGGLGKVMDVLSSGVGFLVIIVLPLLLFFIYQVCHLISVSMKLKSAAGAEQSEKQAQAEKTYAEAEAALAEAKRLKAQAEAALAEAEKMKNGGDEI